MKKGCSYLCMWMTSNWQKVCCLRLDETPENFTEKNHIHVNVQRHFMWNKRQRKRMPGECQTRVFVSKGIWKRDNGHSLVLVLKRSGTVSIRQSPKEFGTIWLKGMLLEFAESGCPIFRATSPLSRGRLRSKGHGK